MYSGHGAAYFQIRLVSDDSLVETIELIKMVTSRKSDTLINRETIGYKNPLTREMKEKSFGFRILDTIQIVSNNYSGTVGDYAIQSGVELTRTEFYKAIRLLQFTNNSSYYILYASRKDAYTQLEQPLMEVLIDCKAFDESGHVTTPDDDVYAGTNEYISNIAQMTITVTAKLLTDSPFLPSPPIPPELVSPTDGADSTYTITFEWEPVSGYTDYQIQIAYSNTQLTEYADKLNLFSTANKFKDEVVSDTEITYTADSDFDKPYVYWHVRVSPGGMWSEIWEVQPFEFGNCIYLNHSDTPKDYLNITNFKSVDSAVGYYFTSLTHLQICFRIKIPAGVTQATMFIANASNGGTTSSCFFLTLTYDGSTGYTIFFRVVNTVSNSMTITSNVLPYDEWITVAVRWDSSLSGGARLKMFVNDVDTGTVTSLGTMPSTTSATNDKQLVIGNRYDLGSTLYLKAYLDQIIFNMKSVNIETPLLTDTQMSNLHNSGKGRRVPVAYFKYDFNEYSGNAIDSGSGNKAINLTNTGGTYHAH